ncbi:MAG: cobalt-zinc-cadmium efflux system outer membrane protein [Candidatus Paceibacteria bacterium]|jgi:cobalt-zinc-cadmium efflux system outer membrane protein
MKEFCKGRSGLAPNGKAPKGALVLPALLLLATACVQVEPSSDFAKARGLVQASTGAEHVFDPESAALSDGDIDEIIADGLSLDEALHLALVNNRGLQAAFQEIGIAHADWVQSRLLSNPSFDALLRFPSEGGRAMAEGNIGLELLQLWRIPVRRDAARGELEAKVLEIARRAGEQFADAKGAYFTAVASAELHAVALENVELATASFEAIRSLHRSGAADAFDENLARGPLLTAQLELQTTRIKASNAMRELGKQLSLLGAMDHVVLTDSLPLGVQISGETEPLVELALDSRLDLKAFEAAIMSLDTKVRLEERRAWGDLAAGPSVERPAGPEGRLLGPSLSLTLPIFDQNQAQVARAGYELERMVKLHESARIAVAQDVRSAVDRLASASKALEFYADELLPQTQNSLALARASYAAGRSTLATLMEVQRQLLEARRAHVLLQLEAATAQSELGRVLGIELEGLLPNTATGVIR